MNAFSLTTVMPSVSFRPTHAYRGLVKALQVAKERRRLATLDDRMLDDLGLTEQQAGFEAARPIWDLPAGR
ncbi:MAG: DUF1127 domain-containing protein [Pseudomonadota bacterium]